jgi:acyl dehydratase
MGIERLNALMTTEKQRHFETEFRLDSESYEVWEEIEVGRAFQAKQTFLIAEEDIVAYNRSALEDDPLFVDPDHARAEGLDHVIAHPMFAIQIAFYCIEKGSGNWLRSPGARNPGQKLVFHQPFRVGEEITLTITIQDKWVRRDKHYLQARFDYHNQDGALKTEWRVNLILPPTRAELRRFADQ